MDGPTRVPPRFVPTLTAVVADAEATAPGGALPEDASFPPAATPAPAAVQDDPPRAGEAAPAAVPESMIALSDADAFRLEEELVHRVLQRIDFSLEERLTEVVSAAVQRQLDAMVPQLRGEIEAVLRALVIEALARELPGNTESQPRF